MNFTPSVRLDRGLFCWQRRDRYADNSHGYLAGLSHPQDEKAIMLWMSQSDNSHQLMRVFQSGVKKKQIAIIRFDLEEYCQKYISLESEVLLISQAF